MTTATQTTSTAPNYTPTHVGRALTANIYAYWQDRGRVWVQEINGSAAKVRFDCGEGSRSKVHTAKTADIDPTREWKFV